MLNFPRLPLSVILFSFFCLWCVYTFFMFSKTIYTCNLQNCRFSPLCTCWPVKCSTLSNWMNLNTWYYTAVKLQSHIVISYVFVNCISFYMAFGNKIKAYNVLYKILKYQCHADNYWRPIHITVCKFIYFLYNQGHGSFCVKIALK